MTLSTLITISLLTLAMVGITIIKTMDDKNLFASFFDGRPFGAWQVFLKALFALPMSDEDAAVFQRHTGRTTTPTDPAREGWLIVGRRGGKSLISAFVAVYLGCFRKYDAHLAPGEVATVMVIAADHRQARTIMRFIGGFFDTVPMLGQMVKRRTRESYELKNRVIIEVHTCSYRAVRGYTIAAAICDEVAFWRSDESANPDTEVINALRPALATMPGSLLLCISSPYARRGALWEAYKKHYAKDDDPVLVWQADTRSMNPKIPEHVVTTAYQDDAAAAAAEYGAEFRRDLETFVDRDAVEACVVPGRTEYPHSSAFSHHGFVDAAGGSGGDSFTLGVAHNEDERIVLDLVREWMPPFSPDAVVAECAAELRRRGVSQVTGDRYAGEFPRELFRKHGVSYQPSEKPKSDIYKELLPLINSERVELLDNARLTSQLCGLERKTARSGKDSIDHALRGHDDLINAAAGALTLAAGTFGPTTRVVETEGW